MDQRKSNVCDYIYLKEISVVNSP